MTTKLLTSVNIYLFYLYTNYIKVRYQTFV